MKKLYFSYPLDEIISERCPYVFFTLILIAFFFFIAIDVIFPVPLASFCVNVPLFYVYLHFTQFIS